jgi:serine/threonine protein kinase
MSHQLDQSDYYNLSAKSKIPVRWSAPELFKSMPYSKKCDVWSFGVTMWEIITNALGNKQQFLRDFLLQLLQ